MIKKIKLSIIIVNFNTDKYLSECLDSVFQSAYPDEAFEVIVIDNASLEFPIKIFAEKFPQVKLIINKVNAGFAKANNIGIKSSHGEYVLLLNPDTVISKDTFKIMTRYMDDNPKVAVSTCRVELATGQLDDACHRGFPTPWNAFCHFMGISAVFPASTVFNGYHLGYRNMDQTHEIDSCAGAFMMIRRNAGESIKWLDEGYFWYGEDIDFCYKVKKAGWKITYVPDTKITHHKGVSAGIKKHSEGISVADKNTKIMATKARFSVMQLFYRKHYQNKYPEWLTWLVLNSIKVKEYFSLLKLRVRP